MANDPSADQHFEFSDPQKGAGFQPAYHSDPRTVPTPKMPSAHFDIKGDGSIETRVEPEQREFIPEPDYETLMNGNGTVNRVLRKSPDYDWSKGVPQFVEDLEAAIEAADITDVPESASKIAEELLKHPGLQGYLDLGDLAHAPESCGHDVGPVLPRAKSLEELIGLAVGAASTCWESLDSTGVFDDARARAIVEEVLTRIPEVIRPADDPEAEHLAQFERYASQGENMQGIFIHKGDVIGHSGNSGRLHYGVDWNGVQIADVDLSEAVWLGNDPEVVPGEGDTAGWERWDRRRPQLMAQAKAGIAALQELAGMAAEHKGFHEDRPDYGPELTNWQGNKLMLIVSEAVEAHDEIRTGHVAYETRYLDKDGTAYQVQEHDFNKAPMFKPEGVPSEIADVVIRSADFAWTEGFDLAEIIIEKLEFNATRGHKHGKQF